MITPKNIALTTILVLLIDLIWIKLFMGREYEKMIYDIQKSELSIRPFFVFLSYTTIILPILLFTLPNIRSEHRFMDSMFYGGLLGLLMYGMFSFTNYSLIEKWSLRVVAMDTIWGFILYTIVSYIVSYYFS
jgi:uncharacterized membrane protein